MPLIKDMGRKIIDKRVKLSNGETYSGFIPLIDQIKYFFTRNLPKEKVLWRRLGTNKIYRFDEENSCLILIKPKCRKNKEKEGEK